jgi:hypothetical protein
MVNFLLTGSHADYKEIIEGTYEKLCKKYPFVDLSKVELYRPEENDTSMANASAGGVIRLNKYWFRYHPDALNKAAKKDVFVPARDEVILWHGPMVEEPEQVLTHEFGHVVEQANTGVVQEWAKKRWLEATKKPSLAPSGYGLTNPSEFFAEAFALYELGLADEKQQEEMYQLLLKLRVEFK